MEVLLRERDRMLISIITKNDIKMKKFIYSLRDTPEQSFSSVVKRYYEKCSHSHAKQFFKVRQQIKKLKADGLTDLNDGYSNPYLQLRVVIDLESINMTENFFEPPI